MFASQPIAVWGANNEKRLLSLLEQPVSSAAALLKRIRGSVWAHIANADQYDGITMLAARRILIS